MTSRETATFERKEKATKTFLKTVSAFANYATGEIVFGIQDDGTVIGLEDPIEECLRIENMINDCIEPTPRFTLDPDMKERTVTLTVFEGPDKPYLANGKAYRRSDSATIEVDRIEYGRLVLEGRNLTYDELPAENQNLSFATLESRLQSEVGIERLDDDVMKTLELLNTCGYTNAAAMLSEQNDFAGIDIVRFGSDISELLDRSTLEGVSAITQLEKALEMYRSYYRYEKIEGSRRILVELVPEAAFREAVANAIVHRTWDVRANVTVSMFADRIEVCSPGALPAGLSKDEYLGGRISLLRNPILANVFFRLRYIEKFGTGVLRINEAYRDLDSKPSFDIRATSIVVTLPVSGGIKMSPDERSVMDVLSRGMILTRAEIASRTTLSKDKTVRILNALLAKNVIEKQGSGRGTRYSRR